MSSSYKILPVKGLCRRFLSVWGPEPHTPLLLYKSVYMYTIFHFTQGRGRGWVESERRGDYRSQSRVENTNMNILFPVNKLWWTSAAKSLYRSFCLDDDILHCLLRPKRLNDINTNVIWFGNAGFCRSGADGGERYQRQRQHPSAPWARPRYSGRLSRLTSTFYNNFCIFNNQRGRTFLLYIATVVNFLHT